MAQNTTYKPLGAIEVFPDTTYTAANLPASANLVVLQRGVRIYDEAGVATPLRGVKMTITNNETPATTPLPNVPFIWIEGDELRFDSAYSYKFHDRGIVGYGTVVAV